jgi:hypothetical protein
MVEEAAEVLETHIVCSLTADCQQLIMIGKVLVFLDLYEQSLILGLND